MFKSEKGVSAVEFALIAPLLFVLTFGIIEFSLLLFDKAVVTNASREGARAAIVFHTDSTGKYEPISETVVREVVKNYTDKYLISLGGAGVLDTSIAYTAKEGGPATAGESGGDVLVTVTYPYTFLVFPNLSELIDGSFDDTISVTGTTLMRME
jgi:Flp pilus assembly protein TadG